MQRQRTYGQREDTPLPESGDLAFVGMDMRAPSLVQPGYVSSAKNRRIQDASGVYETRRGLFSPVWGRHVSTQSPYRSSYVRNDSAEWAAKYATTFGACVYAEPAGETWIARAVANAVLFFRETEIGRVVPFSSGLSLGAGVQVFQNFNQLIVVRGDDFTSLYWAGDWALPAKELVPNSIASGYAAIPNAHFGFAWRDRSAFLCGNDTFVLSRIADSTQHSTGSGSDPAGIFYVNRGRGDRLRAGVPIGASSVLLLKSQSLHVFSATAGDLSDARVDPQPVEMQFDSPLTAVAADGKVWWLDRRGIRTAEVSAIDANNKVLLRVDSSVSDKIAPLIRRINWATADQFSAVVTTDRIFFAVALDTQTTPQTLLVWNRQLQEWESWDQWDASTLGDFHVQAFAPAVPWLNQPRLFGVDGTGQIVCFEFGLGEDHVGWSGDAAIRVAIDDELVTRGYTAGTNDPKRITRAQVQLDTWNALVGLQAIFDGPGETLDLAAVARMRSDYFTGAPAFVGDNADGRFHAPKRQDYSLALAGGVPASSNPTWTNGVTYAAGGYCYRDTNGHNYRSLVLTTADLGDIPAESPLIWKPVGPYNADNPAHWDPIVDDLGNQVLDNAGNPILTGHAPFRVIGKTYAAGAAIQDGDVVYICLRSHTASNGTRPEEHPEIWQDLGVDTSLTDGAIYLDGNGGTPDGVRLEDFQTKPERRDVGREAAWCQIAIRGTQGANKVRSVALETAPGSRTNLAAA